MVLYIITKAHFQGDHCHIVGVYTDYDLARVAYKGYFNELGLEQCLIQFHKIDENQFNRQLYEFDCEDSLYESCDEI